MYGISGCLLMWINAFLTDRYQCVIIDHCFSEWSPVISGVPQGSVLGPILFIMFIDDIFEVFIGSTVTHQLFADDLKLFSTVNSSGTAASVQSTLDRLQLWCTNWQLTINTQKCFVLHLGKTNSKTVYTLYGCRINVAQNVADLGVDINCKLKYDTHINNIIGKAYSRVGILFKGFASRSLHILRQAFITYVRPVLEYASSVWSPYLLKHINAIEQVQKRFTRRIDSLSHLSYPERFAAINLEPLELRRLKSDLIMYFKCLNNLAALLSDEYFCQQINVSQTRSGVNRLIIPLCSTNYF
jgi:ribonuclease P/MRP protein subunit RPP40